MDKHIAKAISEIRRRLDEIEKELAKIPQTSGSFDGISPKWFDLNDFPKDVRVRKTLIRVAGLVHEDFTDEQIRKSKVENCREENKGHCSARFVFGKMAGVIQLEGECDSRVWPTGEIVHVD